MTNTDTTAGAIAALAPFGFERIINSRFVAWRDGSPILCTNCGEALVMGAAYSGQRNGKWSSFCADCAVSFPTYVARKWRVLADRALAVGVDTDAAIPALQALVAAPTDAVAYREARVALADLATLVEAAERNERKAILAVDPLYLGLALATEWCKGRFQVAAESMLDQWERKGALSPKQVSYAEAIAEAARKAEAKSVSAPASWANELHDAITASGLSDGYFAVPAVAGNNDLTFVRIGTDDRKVRFMRHIVGGHGELPSGAMPWCQAAIDAIVLDPNGAMATYGQQIGRCGACHRQLTDQVSRSFGIGPVCRDNLGL